MAMDEFATLYGKLRAALLSRHFAINNQFRINFLRDSSRLLTGMTPDELAGQPSSTQLLERWKVYGRGGDNPLMLSGMLMTCLAVEYYLGRRDVLLIIRTLMETIGSLYKCSGDHFDGYIIRWDPVLDTEERWVMEDSRRFNRAFFLNQDLTYNYSTPIHDPRSRRQLSRADWEAASPEERARLSDWSKGYNHWYDFFRRWEASMDELVGLIMGYDMTYRLVDDADVRAEVRRQANNLGDYLAEHGYYLVRPGGGFNARGASGVLPALEYPFSRAFLRITGNPYYIRNGFQAVMEKADVWKALEGPYNWATVAGLAATVVLGSLFGFIAGVAAPMGLGFIFGATGPFTAVQLAQIWQIWEHRDVFDVWNRVTPETYDDGNAGEFAAAYALSLLSLRRRFDVYMNGAQTAGGWAAGFPPFLGLIGLDDQEPNVRTAYLNWFRGRRQRADIGDNDFANSIFASAAAVVLGAGEEEERRLVELLGAHRNAFQDVGDDLFLRLYEYDKTHKETHEETLGGPPTALGYMTALALAWLHRKRRQDEGRPVTTPDFPDLPDASPWPAAAVPPDVLKEAKEGRITLPSGAIQRSTPLHLTPDGAADIFYDDPAVPKSPIPPVLLPDPPRPLAISEEFTVPERVHHVSTGIMLCMGDEFEIEASGRIWAGVWVTGENGPNGWEDRIEYDRKFPLTGRPNGHPYCLLGKLGGDGAYFFIGEHRPRERYLGEEPHGLFLRINDDSPGNGSGAFTVRVRVWGQPLRVGSRISCIIPDSDDADRRIDAVGGEYADGTRWLVSLDEAIAFVENGHLFFVECPEGDRVEVIVATRSGRKYLKTVADGDEPNNLLSLPGCS